MATTCNSGCGFPALLVKDHKYDHSKHCGYWLGQALVGKDRVPVLAVDFAESN